MLFRQHHKPVASLCFRFEADCQFASGIGASVLPYAVPEFSTGHADAALPFQGEVGRECSDCSLLLELENLNAALPHSPPSRLRNCSVLVAP